MKTLFVPWDRYVFILILSCSAFTAFSQTVLPPSRVDLAIEYVGLPQAADSLYSDPSTMFLYDSVHLKLMILIPSTSGVAKIHTKIGTTNGGSELIQKAFIYDGDAVMPDGTTYSRNNDVIYLGLGKYYGLEKVYVEVELEDNSGSKSVATTTNFNG